MIQSIKSNIKTRLGRRKKINRKKNFFLSEPTHSDSKLQFSGREESSDYRLSRTKKDLFKFMNKLQQGMQFFFNGLFRVIGIEIRISMRCHSIKDAKREVLMAKINN